MKRTISGITLTFLLIGMLTLAFDIQLVKAIEKIRITDDGSVDPPDAPISSVDNVTYTFTDNIYNTTILVERGNIIVDGNGYTLQGDGTSHGFYVSGKNNVTIKKTNISSFIDGLTLWESDYSRAIDNNITNIQRIGIWIEASFNTTVKGNNVSRVWIENSNHTAISDNHIGRISILYSSGNSISGNNYIGHILIHYSSANSVSGNVISGNTGAGIDIKGSRDNMISGNVISGNTGAGIDISDSPSNIMTNNTMNNNRNGIWLDSSSNNFIENSTISKNQEHGIYVKKSNSTNLIGNYVINNQYGIYLYEYDYDTISDNYVENNTQRGIHLDLSSRNTVSCNHIANNTRGILLIWSHYNTLTDNNITSSTMNGIEIAADSHDNKIYRNNFVDNTNQTYVLDPGGNTWNNGYPSGGNYWSDYAGEDECKGPNQNITGTDGIGDNPYVIGDLNIDHYPLMPPYPPHDIGIINVEKPKGKTIVGQGYPLHISVTIVNYGINIENLNLTLYANGISFVNKNIPLPNRSMDTLTITWDTTPFAKGNNYTISAYATPVPGETDKADNTFQDGMVYVGIPGDVDGNNFVEIKDLLAIALAYGSHPGDPKYEPNLDINDDNFIDIKDILTAALNYGQTYP